MMRRLLPALLLTALVAGPAHAEDRRFGLGVVVGSEVAVDVKVWLGSSFSVEAGGGLADFSRRPGAFLDLEGALLTFAMGGDTVGQLYGGVGAVVAFAGTGDDLFGEPARDGLDVLVMVPLGWDIQLGLPIDVFVEARLGAVVHGEVRFAAGVHAGARWVY